MKNQGVWVLVCNVHMLTFFRNYKCPINLTETETFMKNYNGRNLIENWNMPVPFSAILNTSLADLTAAIAVLRDCVADCPPVIIASTLRGTLVLAKSSRIGFTSANSLPYKVCGILPFSYRANVSIQKHWTSAWWIRTQIVSAVGQRAANYLD